MGILGIQMGTDEYGKYDMKMSNNTNLIWWILMSKL